MKTPSGLHLGKLLGYRLENRRQKSRHLVLTSHDSPKAWESMLQNSHSHNKWTFIMSSTAHAALLGHVHWWGFRETMVSLRYANESASCFGHNVVSSLWDWIFITMPRKRELKLRPVPSGNAILPTHQDGIFRGQLPLSSPFIQSSKRSNTNCAVRSQDDGYIRGCSSE